jgi:hypothetical protein
LEDQTLLSAVWKRKLNLSIKSTWTEQCWVKSVSSVGCHDALNIHMLVETIHLLK